MNDENFNIENKFINYGTEQKKKKKSKKIIFIIILIILLGIAGYLFYANKVEKKSNKKSNDNYEEYDPNYQLEESNTTSNITADITSNITSNITVTSNVVTSNSNIKSNITVTSNSNKNSNTNSKVSVKSISFTSSTTGINVGGSKNLSVIIKPTNATNKGVTWSSSNTNIFTVDNNGKITGKKVGTATITATTKDGGKKATCTVTVTANKVTVQGIKLSVSTLDMVKGKIIKLPVTITPSNATNQEVIWSSSNNNIVSVDQSGNIKGVNAGTATITATTKDGNKKATCRVNVAAPPVSSISMTSSTTIIYVGSGSYIYPKINYYPSDARGKSVKWTSSNPKVATVRYDGRVTGISEGDVWITATTPNGKGTAKLFYVREDPNNFEIVWRPLYSGKYVAAYQPLVYRSGVEVGFKSISYKGTTYYASSSPGRQFIDKSVTKGSVVTAKGYELTNVKVTYK